MSELLCPKCGSDQLTANKKGFSGKKAIGGGLLFGPLGLLAGTLGSNKVKITCLSCGHKFKPGQGAKSSAEFERRTKPDITATIIVCIIIFGTLFLYIKACG